MRLFTGSRPSLVLIPLAGFIVANVFFLINLASEPRANQIVGMIVTNIGLTLWMMARLQFATAPAHEDFVTQGLYGKLRHPVYYSALLVLIGVILFLWQLYLVPALVALIALQAVRITKAELMLKNKFGDRYRAHRQRTWF